MFSRKNNIQNSTTTSLLALVLVASFAGTMISTPQIIGSVEAQANCKDPNYSNFLSGNNGGLGAICEDGPPTADTCATPASVPPNGAPTSVSAQPTNGICTATYANNGNAAQESCAGVGGTGPTGSSHTCTYPATGGSCPATTTGQTPQVNPQSGNCFIKPGN